MNEDGTFRKASELQAIGRRRRTKLKPTDAYHRLIAELANGRHTPGSCSLYLLGYPKVRNYDGRGQNGGTRHGSYRAHVLIRKRRSMPHLARHHHLTVRKNGIVAIGGDGRLNRPDQGGQGQCQKSPPVGKNDVIGGFAGATRRTPSRFLSGWRQNWNNIRVSSCARRSNWLGRLADRPVSAPAGGYDDRR